MYCRPPVDPCRWISLKRTATVKAKTEKATALAEFLKVKGREHFGRPFVNQSKVLVKSMSRHQTRQLNIFQALKLSLMCLNIYSGEDGKKPCILKQISASISYCDFNKLNEKRDKMLIFIIGF